MLQHQISTACHGCIFCSRTIFQRREFFIASHFPDEEVPSVRISVFRKGSNSLRFVLLGTGENVEDELLEFDAVDRCWFIDTVAIGTDRWNLLLGNMIVKLTLVMSSERMVEERISRLVLLTGRRLGETRA